MFCNYLENQNLNYFEVITLDCFRHPLSNALQCQEMKEQFMDGFAEYVKAPKFEKKYRLLFEEEGHPDLTVGMPIWTFQVGDKKIPSSPDLLWTEFVVEEKCWEISMYWSNLLSVTDFPEFCKSEFIIRVCWSKCTPLIDLINVHEKFNVNARSVILITQMRSQGLTSSQKVNLVKIGTNVLSLSELRVLLSINVLFRFYKIAFSIQWMHFFLI